MWANSFDKICSFEKKHFRLTGTRTVVVGLFVGGVGGGGRSCCVQHLNGKPRSGRGGESSAMLVPKQPGSMYPAFSRGLIIRFITNRRSFSVLGSRKEKTHLTQGFLLILLTFECTKHLLNTSCVQSAVER